MSARLFILACFPIFISCFLISCGKERSPVDPKPDTDVKPQIPLSEVPAVIGVTTLTYDDPFFKYIEDSMKEEATRHGHEVIAVSGEENTEAQLAQIQDFIAQKVDAIVIAPCDPAAVGSAIREATEAGIPVFTFYSESKASDAKVISHIARNDHESGELAGRAMIDALGESGGKIMILDVKSPHKAVDIVRGFKSVIERFNISRPEGKIEIQYEESIQAATEEPSEFESLLKENPEVDGIFTTTELPALKIVSALEKFGRQDQVTVIASNVGPAGKKAIRNGRIFASPVQPADKIGRYVIEAIAEYLAGNEVPELQVVPSEMYRREDAADDPELK